MSSKRKRLAYHVGEDIVQIVARLQKKSANVCPAASYHVAPVRVAVMKDNHREIMRLPMRMMLKMMNKARDKT